MKVFFVVCRIILFICAGLFALFAFIDPPMIVVAIIILVISILLNPQKATDQTKKELAMNRASRQKTFSAPLHIDVAAADASTETPPSGVRIRGLRGRSRLTPDSYVVLDFETTGLSSKKDHIIEVAVLKVQNGLIAGSYESFVNPCMDIPDHITELTGITNKDVICAPTIETVIKDVAAFIPEEAPIVAHNASFDASFLAEAFRREGISRSIPYIDTVSLAKEAFPYLQNHKLDTLIKELNLSGYAQTHRAMDDVNATYKLYLLCKESLT